MPNWTEIANIVKKSTNFYKELAKCDPKLERGMVWCDRCGRSEKVNSGEAFRKGWPECCGHTMSIDSPEERLNNNA